MASTAPGCGASSDHCDLDHTRAWPDGDTDECNLGPPCRHHHRLKQAPSWELTQPAPGVFRWKTPSGRVYDTGPTKYDLQRMRQADAWRHNRQGRSGPLCYPHSTPIRC